MKLEVNIDKKYFFILLGALIIIGGIIGVYAVLNPTIPSPGHAVADLQKCSEGETLKIVGGVWTCATAVTSCQNFGGLYGVDSSEVCQYTNPFTGSCSCPSGYSVQKVLSAAQYGEIANRLYMCYKTC